MRCFFLLVLALCCQALQESTRRKLLMLRPSPGSPAGDSESEDLPAVAANASASASTNATDPDDDAAEKEESGGENDRDDDDVAAAEESAESAFEDDALDDADGDLLDDDLLDEDFADEFMFSPSDDEASDDEASASDDEASAFDEVFEEAFEEALKEELNDGKVVAIDAGFDVIDAIDYVDDSVALPDLLDEDPDLLDEDTIVVDEDPVDEVEDDDIEKADEVNKDLVDDDEVVEDEVYASMGDDEDDKDFIFSLADDDDDDDEGFFDVTEEAPPAVDVTEEAAPAADVTEETAPPAVDVTEETTPPAVTEEAPPAVVAPEKKMEEAVAEETSPSSGWVNERWTLVRAVARGEMDPDLDVELLREKIGEVPVGTALIRTEVVSVDAFARTKARSAKSGDTLPAMGVGIVVKSNLKSLRPGTRVVGNLGAQRFVFVDAFDQSIRPTRLSPFLALGLCGASTGLAAYLAVKAAAAPKIAGVVVVTAAHTAMGLAAARLYKRAGVKVCLGLAPGKSLCDRLVAEKIVDVAVDSDDFNDDLGRRLDAAVKEKGGAGVDVVFDCGGRGFDLLLLDRLNRAARVLVCAPSIREDDDDRHRDLFGAYDDLAERSVALVGFHWADHLAALPVAKANMLWTHFTTGLHLNGYVADLDAFPVALAALVNTAFSSSNHQSPGLHRAQTLARTRLGQIFIDLRPKKKATSLTISNKSNTITPPG